MNRRLFGAFGVLTIVVFPLGSCKSDPLSDLDGNPAAIVTNFDLVRVAVGDTVTVTSSVLDARSTPLAVPIAFRTCSTVATHCHRSRVPPPPSDLRARHRYRRVAGTTCVIASADGLEDTVDVLFPHARSPAGPHRQHSVGRRDAVTYQFLDHQGNVLAGLPAPTFT